MAADLLTPEERELVERVRKEWGSEMADASKLRVIIDRLAPRPKEFSWAPGHTVFPVAARWLSPLLTDENMVREFAAVMRGNSPWTTGAVLATKLGFLSLENGKVVVLEPGKAFLKDYNTWLMQEED